jgi:ethanolamine utilization protein EutN
MRLAEVIGRVTLSQCDPTVTGGTWIVAVPLLAEGIAAIAAGNSPNSPGTGREEAIIVYDDLGASPGDIIAVSEGAEASAPFHPDSKPLDAYNACLLDKIELTNR